jgi:uncharacterized protein (DUF2147 family)
MRQLLGSAIVAAACLAAACESGTASPVGLWLANDGAKLRISQCGENLCGFIAQASQSIDPATGQPPTDKNNSDPAKRGRPLVGVEVLISMHREAPNRWTGQVYNDDDGKVYAGNLIENGPTSIRVEGCWLGICGGNDLTRVK